MGQNYQNPGVFSLGALWSEQPMDFQLAFGNSGGDFEMLEWTTAGSGPRLGLIVHHDDGVRGYAYDRKSAMGSVDRRLDEAEKRGGAVRLRDGR